MAQNTNNSVVILSAVRTAIGSFGGSLKNFSPAELGTLCAKEALNRSKVSPNQVGSCVVGKVIHNGPKDAYLSTHWSKLKIFQITPCTKILCSYIAIKLPSVRAYVHNREIFSNVTRRCDVVSDVKQRHLFLELHLFHQVKNTSTN